MRRGTRVVGLTFSQSRSTGTKVVFEEFVPVHWLRIPWPTRATATVLRTYLETQKMTTRPALRVSTPRLTITTQSDCRSGH
jgi:hypothetical protein